MSLTPGVDRIQRSFVSSPGVLNVMSFHNRGSGVQDCHFVSEDRWQGDPESSAGFHLPSCYMKHDM